MLNAEAREILLRLVTEKDSGLNVEVIRSGENVDVSHLSSLLHFYSLQQLSPVILEIIAFLLKFFH